MNANLYGYVAKGIPVDYIDLKGHLRTLTIDTDSPHEAVEVMREAWNSKRVWYFKLHLPDADPLCMTRRVPWSESILRSVLTLANLLKHAAGARRSFELQEKEVLLSLSYSPDSRPPSDMRRFSQSFAEWKGMDYMADRLTLELKSAGIDLSGVTLADKAIAIASVADALKSLKQVEKNQYDSMFTFGRTTRVSVSDFLSRLPIVEGIFSTEQEAGVFAALEREA